MEKNIAPIYFVSHQNVQPSIFNWPHFRMEFLMDWHFLIMHIHFEYIDEFLWTNGNGGYLHFVRISNVCFLFLVQSSSSSSVCLSIQVNLIIIPCYWIYQHIILILNATIFSFCFENPLINLSQFFFSRCSPYIWLVTILTGCHFQLLVLCKMVNFFSQTHKTINELKCCCSSHCDDIWQIE